VHNQVINILNHAQADGQEDDGEEEESEDNEDEDSNPDEMGKADVPLGAEEKMISSDEEDQLDKPEKLFKPVDCEGKEVEDDPNHKKMRIIVWFRNDLRLHDNPALAWAVECSKTSNDYHEIEIVPVFCFDPRIYQAKTRYDTRKTGALRTMFNIDSVNDLRKNLEAAGSKLLILIGKPEECIQKLVHSGWTTQLVYTEEVSPEDIKI
jgi:hypothetical protein